jgi:neopullulanase
MKRMSWGRVILFMLVSFPALASGIKRVDPQNWWVGMHSDALQLMVHGQDIASSEPQLDHPGVRIERVTRLASPNYLFIDLNIAPNTKPGELEIRFKGNGETEILRYPLLARELGSAERRGFGGMDVILNLMPDRFSNGNPRNDDPPGMSEASNRNAPSGRHGGDLQGLENHLGYLSDMGFTMIWPTPMMENNQKAYSYHGYAITDLYRVDRRFGSNDDYRRFVAKARKNNIGVIQDMVPNHIGDGHPWMQDPPSSDWISYGGKFQATKHARNALSDPYAAKIDREDFTQGWFAPSMPDLNQRQPQLATYLKQNAVWWIEFAGLSGFRVDTVGYSDTDFVAQWTGYIRNEYPNFSIVGEEWSNNPLVVARWQQDGAGMMASGRGMPNMMDFPLSEALRRALPAKESFDTGFIELYSALVTDPLYADPNKLVVFDGNHDMPRLYSVLGEDMGLYRMAMVYVATAPRIPQFYYGSEVLMTSPVYRDDPAARRDFPGGWSGDAVNAFNGQGLNAKQREAQSFVRKLLNWRKQATAIHSGKMLHYAPEAGVYVYFRYDDKQRVMVILNKNTTPTRLDLARFSEGLGESRRAVEVLSNEAYSLDKDLLVPERSALILSLE